MTVTSGTGGNAVTHSVGDQFAVGEIAGPVRRDSSHAPNTDEVAPFLLTPVKLNA